MNAGETFFLRQAVSRDTHLWVVAFSEGGRLIIFNFTSHKSGCDESCLVKVGEHPYVTRKSIIAYQFGMLFEPGEATALESHGVYKKHAPVSDELLLRIRRGGVASKLTSEELKRLLRTVI